MKEDYKNSSDEVVSQYYSLTKQDVILESSCFNERNFNPRTCQQVLTKLIYLFDKGEKFSEEELSTLFFSITKLFQSNDDNLKRLLFLTIKYMKDTPSICMITNCVTKDVSSPNVNIKANAIRLLPLILESQNPIQLERTLKLCLLHKSPVIVDASLTACAAIFKKLPNVVKKCGEEIGQVLRTTKEENLQYKAFLLLEEVKAADKVSLVKLLTFVIEKKQDFSALTVIYVIRAVKVFIEQGAVSENSLDQRSQIIFTKFLQDCVESDNRLLQLEASKVLTSLNSLDNSSLQPVIEKLFDLLETENTILQYSILKIFNATIANPFRTGLFRESEQLRTLMESSNKNVMALAVAILVKVTPPEGLQELIDKVFDSLDELPSEIRKSVVLNCVAVVKKDAQSLDSVLKFLWNCLKEKGDVEFKLSVVGVFRQILELKLSCYSAVLDYFAEYIEDSIDPRLTLSILNLMGAYLPRTENPKEYLKFLINRLTLDNGDIRTAVVTCLGQVALQDSSLRGDISAIFEQLRFDSEEEEVRERCLFYLSKLNDIENDQQPTDIAEVSLELPEETVEDLLAQLEAGKAGQDFDTSFLDFKAIFNNTLSKKTTTTKTTKNNMQPQFLGDSGPSDLMNYKGVNTNIDEETKAFMADKEEFADLGPVHITTDYIDLSEPETEVYIRCRKHIHDAHVVVEFFLTNNEEHTLRSPKLNFDFESDEDFSLSNVVAQDTIKPNTSGRLFAVFQNAAYLAAKEISTVLLFTVEVEEDGKVVTTYEDEIHCEDFQIKISDFVARYPFRVTEEGFDDLWAAFKTPPVEQNFQLEFDSVGTAATEIGKTLGMQSVGEENTESNQNFFRLKLCGLYLQGSPILVESKIGFDNKKKCIVSLSVRSYDEDLSESFLDI